LSVVRGPLPVIRWLRFDITDTWHNEDS